MLREAVEKELSAWLIANQSVRVVENLLSTSPGDPVLEARLATAQAQRTEATTMLKAALRASGHSLEDLQAELKQLQ